jgi:hypothetical protein
MTNSLYKTSLDIEMKIRFIEIVYEKHNFYIRFNQEIMKKSYFENLLYSGKKIKY